MKSQTRHIALKVAAVLLLSTCNPFAWSQNTPNITNWKATKEDRHLTIRINPDANRSLYNTIQVGNVAYTGPAGKFKQKDSENLVTLLHDSLERDLSTAKLSQQTSATGTLTLNANITHVKRSHPMVNVITTAAVFVPLDLGEANVTAWIVDRTTGQPIAEIEIVGCGQIYQVLPSFQALGQSKLLLKKESRTIAKELSRMHWDPQPSNLSAAAISSTQ
jgi:hypothetical protein